MRVTAGFVALFRSFAVPAAVVMAACGWTVGEALASDIGRSDGHGASSRWSARALAEIPRSLQALPYRILTYEGVDQDTAPLVVVDAEAALYLIDLGRVEVATSPSLAGTAAAWVAAHPEASGVHALPVPNGREERATLAAFLGRLASEYPALESGAFGRYLLKLPSAREAPPFVRPAGLPPVAAQSVVVTEGFESDPWSRWTRGDSTAGQYQWERTACDAHGGSQAVDAVRGGTAGTALACTDAYPLNAETWMEEAACENLAGSGQAWLDLYVSLGSESGYDPLGFYYQGDGSNYSGVLFSGNTGGWIHLIFNLQQWPMLGDLSLRPCPRLLLDFSSDDTIAPGFGARVDDISVRRDEADVVTCSGAASPSSGEAPLTVAFSGSASGASQPLSYSWSFDDGGSSTEQSPSHTYMVADDYIARLRVTDATSNRCYAYVPVSVSAGAGTPPQAGNYAGTTSQGKKFEFTVDSSGKITAYTYGFVCGPVSGESTVTYTSGGCDASSGTFQCGSSGCSSNQTKAQFGGTFDTSSAASGWLKIYIWPYGLSSCCSNENLTWSASLSNGPSPLAATAQANVTSGSAPLVVQFTGGASGGTTPYGYAWSFGDGATSSVQSPSHTFTSAGTYNVVLTVTDAASQTATAPVTITVSGGTATYRYLVPSVAHLPGAGGTLWRTDVGVVYRPEGGGTGSASVSLRYRGDTGEITQTESVVAGNGVEWRNVLESVFGMGSGTRSSGSLELESSVPLYVTSRTYNDTPTGTFGQYYPALTDADALMVGEVGILPQLRKSAGFRTNIGMMNLGSGTCTGVVRLYAGGVQVGSTKQLTADAGKWVQQYDVFPNVGAGNQDMAYATVEVQTSSCKAWFYASLVDAATGDPTTIPVLVH